MDRDHLEPGTGCTKISDGCKHCYAERMATRLQAMGVEKYRNGFDLTVHESVLEEPLRWKSPRIVFVNSMSDLFHESVPAAFIESVFRVMNRASQHTFQVLTKRPARVMQLDPGLRDAEYLAGHEHRIQRVARPIGEAERSQRPHEIPISRTVTGAIARPGLGRSDWVIVGGESGPGARPMKADWVREIRDNCLRSGVPFFFKQWGGVFKKQTGRVLDNKKWDQMPDFKTICTS